MAIKTARDVHGVQTPERYAALHRATLERKRDRGVAIEEHAGEPGLVARVDAGRLLVDCECHAGNAVCPGWPEARCFGCGAVHTGIVIPPEIIV